MEQFYYRKAWFAYIRPELRGEGKLHRSTLMKAKAMFKRISEADLRNPKEREAVEEYIIRVASSLKTEQLARLAAVSYHYGQWIPLYMKPFRRLPLDSGQSWIISNICDRILRERYKTVPYGDLFAIENGLFRTNQGHFAILATVENLTPLRVYENYNKTEKWNLDNEFLQALVIPEYDKYLQMERKITQRNLRAACKQRVKKKADGIRDAKTEYKASKWLYEHNIDNGNVVFYPHLGRFSFGYIDRFTPEQAAALKQQLDTLMFPYSYEIKTTEDPII